MSDVVKQWLGILFILILVFLLISPNMRANEIITSVGRIQLETIRALQGRGG